MKLFFTSLLLSGFCLTANAVSVLQGTVSFLNSGSRPAAGVKVSAFGANDFYTTDAGMFRLEFPDKKPGDRVRIIIGSADKNGASIELVNDKVVAQARIPSNPDDDILEIIVCRSGQRNDAALNYNGIIVKTINESIDRRLKEIDSKLGAAVVDAETLISLQREKEKLAEERDSAMAKAEEQALFIASINLDKAGILVKEAVRKVDSLQDIVGAILVLDNEMLFQAYLEAGEKKRKAEAEIQQVISGFEIKIKLLEPMYRYEEIAVCYQKIVEIYEKEGLDKEKLAQYVSESANYWGQNGNYQKQLELNQKALEIRESLPSAEQLQLALSYDELARSYWHLGDYKKQLEFNQKSLAVKEKSLPAEHLELARLYNSICLAYNNTGETKLALEYMLKAVAIKEKLLAPDDPQLGEMYNNLAYTYGNNGDNKNQLAFHLKAKDIREKKLPPDHPDLGFTYNNLAYSYRVLGDHEKSLEFNLKAMKIREKILPPLHPNLAQTYTNLAVSYANMNQDYLCLEYNLKALKIRDKVLPQYHPDIAITLNNLSSIYSRLGYHDKDLYYNLRAVEIREKSLPSNHPSTANSYINTSRAYRNLNQYALSIDFAERAICIGEETTPKHARLNSFYAELFFTCLKAGFYDQARAALDKCESIKKDESTCRYRAMLAAAQNDPAKALEYMREALGLGFKSLRWVETEPWLDGIRRAPGYNELLAELEKRQ